MIQNRFFKTTVGVPFDLLIGGLVTHNDQYPTANTPVQYGSFANFAETAAANIIALFRQDNNGIAAGQLLSDPYGTMSSDPTLAQATLFFSLSNSGGAAATGTTNSPSFRANSVTCKAYAYKAPTVQNARITKASGTVNLNQELVFKIVETTPLNNTLPSYEYTAKVITTFDVALAKIVTTINKGKEDEFFTAVAVTNGIQIVSKDSNRHFRLAMDVAPTRAFPFNDTNWLYAVTTPAFAGSGTLEQVRQLELESNIKRGVTTQYPGEGLSPLDFGTPTSVLSAGLATNFDIFVFNYTKTEESPTPLERHTKQSMLIIAVATGKSGHMNAFFNS